RGDAEVPDEAEEVGALEAQHAGGVGAVAAHLVERRFDQPSLERRDGAVVAEARLEQGWPARLRAPRPCPSTGRNRCARHRRSISQRLRPTAFARMPGGPGGVPRGVCSYFLVAGLTPGWSLKNCLLSSM